MYVCVCTYSNINVMFHLRAYTYIIIYNVYIIKNLKHTYINEIQMQIMFLLENITNLHIYGFK